MGWFDWLWGSSDDKPEEDTQTPTTEAADGGGTGQPAGNPLPGPRGGEPPEPTDPPPAGDPVPDPTIPDPVPDPQRPDLVLFRRASSNYRSPTGMLIKVLQAALRAGNYYTGSVDGEFGAKTHLAVLALQRDRGTTEDGLCRESDWEQVTGLPAPSTFDRCLLLTAAFEGTGFDTAVGNFDGAYLTWGIIGYTLKHDMPDFMDKVEEEFPGTIDRAFGQKAGQLRRILKASNSEKQRWGNLISTGRNSYGVRADWKNAFARLGSVPEVQRLQISDAKARYWRICLRDARRWQATDTMDIAMFFDTAVQNGGAGRASISGPLDQLLANEPQLTGVERRHRWAQIISQGSNSFARVDVLSRRATIADGDGRVHGANYLLEDWALVPRPVDLGQLDGDHATFLPATFESQVEVGTDSATSTDSIPPIVHENVGGETAITSLDFKTDFLVVMATALPHVTRSDLDRAWGAPRQTTITELLRPRSHDVQERHRSSWQGWDASRKGIAVIQLVAKDSGADPGPVDGFWGPQTQFAFDSLVHLRDHGELPPDWRDNPPTPIDANPNNWPRQSQMTSHYGSPCQINRVTVPCPWTLRLAWDLDKTVSGIGCHEMVAESLSRVLAAVHREYGETRLRELRLDRYGGCYNCRKMRGGSAWSTHAWAIAIDWDPDNNRLRWKRDRATLARPEYNAWWEIWEQEGWLSLGRTRDFDWMHVQAAKL